MAELAISRLQYRKQGFRTKISRQLYVFRKGETIPVAGPFNSRREAETARDGLRAKERGIMTEKTKRETETRETETTERKDPSDQGGSQEPANAPKAGDGDDAGASDESK